jgi:predicted GNAT superfamily acetyltransferase
VSRIEIRPLASQKEYQACLALQRRTWGKTFADAIPPSMLQIAQRTGGVATGAFDARGSLVGFVFGVTGVERGVIVHWSDMLAVIPKVRNLGIGRRLKEHQRAYVATQGAKVIYWTYDPLVARNANLNFNVFGVRVVEYVENMYGASQSPLHRGIGTDRFIVAWPVDDRDLALRRAEIEAAGDAGRGTRGAVVTVEVPLRIDLLQSKDMRAARKWRRSTRAAFADALKRGYQVNGFRIDDKMKRGYYVLTR